MTGVRSILCALSLALSAPLFGVDAPVRPYGTNANAGFNDNVDRNDPNFVKASLIIVGPGNDIFSGVGHAAFRLECPTFKHDYCYSYEGEPISHQLLQFFAGKLKMGMLVFKTEDLLNDYRKAGRNVRQYALNLPPDAKQRLWKAFDEKLAKGMTQPYDYNERGCARAAFLVLREAMAPLRFDAYAWPSKYEGTRRELTSARLAAQPWSRFFLHAIWGTAVDRADIGKMDKVVIPLDLLEFLQKATINGTPVITDQGAELLAGTPMSPPSVITPMVVAIVMLVFTVLSVFLRRFGGKVGAACVGWQGVMMAVYAFAGLFFAYMVFVSDLPATEWNWLVVPFNPLPLVFWAWRGSWALPFAIVIVAWMAFMVFAPHQLTDWAYVVLAGGFAVLYFGIWRRASRACV